MEQSQNMNTKWSPLKKQQQNIHVHITIAPKAYNIEQYICSYNLHDTPSLSISDDSLILTIMYM